MLPILRNVQSMAGKDQMLFTLSVKQVVVSFLSALLSIYGIVYADGQSGTTWFHCNSYRMHFFGYQKYCNAFLLGMAVPDMLVLLRFYS